MEYNIYIDGLENNARLALSVAIFSVDNII